MDPSHPLSELARSRVRQLLAAGAPGEGEEPRSLVGGACIRCLRPGFPIIAGRKVKRICTRCCILDQKEGWPATFAAAGPQGCSVCAAGKPDRVTVMYMGGLQIIVAGHCSGGCRTELMAVVRRAPRFQTQVACSACGKTAARMRGCDRCRMEFCSEECQAASWPAHKEVCVSRTGEKKELADRARCRVCRRKRPLLSCGRCGAGYCGNLCQKLDWFTGHSTACATSAAPS
jgi:hypothetical protein